MSKKDFQTVQGIQIEHLGDLQNGYEVTHKDGLQIFTVVSSAGKMKSILKEYCDLVPAPGYFTLELPNEDASEYSVYYVDGCTRPVLQAIVKRYGDLLINDGFVRFGFAGHDSPEQLFVTDLKTIQIYTQNPEKIAKMLKGLGFPKLKNCKKLWDVTTEQNPCILAHVEVDEESIFDLPDLLSGAGIYLSGKREA